MRKFKILGSLLFIVVIGTLLFAFSNSAEVPKKVKEAFTMKFPTFKKVSWDEEEEGEWEAEFKLKGVEYSANFLEDGTWMETEHEIKKSAIPAIIKNTLANEFAGYKIDEAEVSETVEGMYYEFELEKSKHEMEVSIDMNGKVIKQEMSDNNEE
jgi:hypothetical protein